MTPTYSICKNHGYLHGEQYKCPECGESTEVYSRITGYYRPVQNWNDGKAQEFKERKVYTPFKKADDFCESCQMPVVQVEEPVCESCHFDVPTETTCESCNCETGAPASDCNCDCHGLFLVATKDCPKCKQATEFLTAAGIEFTKVYAEDDMTLVQQFGLSQAPVLIDMRGEDAVLYSNLSDIRKFIEQ